MKEDVVMEIDIFDMKDVYVRNTSAMARNVIAKLFFSHVC